MKTTVSTKGQIVIPAEIREADGIEPGDELEIERLARGDYRLRRTTRNTGLVDLLLSCPTKGWFREIPSESTDEL